MTDAFVPPHRLPAWQVLQTHRERLGAQRVGNLFSEDPARFDALSRRACGLLADFSRQRLDPAALAALLDLAAQARLAEGIAALFGGKPVNYTEGRAALHMALRGTCPPPAADADTFARTNERMRAFATALRDGRITGCTGWTIRRVVNLGIGGSDLGPRMVAEALAGPAGRNPVSVRFAANLDPQELDEALADAEPAETLFIVASKSFTTAETLANAEAARAWLRAALGESADIGAHFAAVTNATAAALAFGIAAERLLPMPEWVGGRYSVWSAIGLPLLVALGEARFDALLAGARAMDEHFRTAPFADNLPVLMGLVGLWNTDFLDQETLAVLPYAHGLRSFPAWLQQLEMESNGKRTLRDGSTTAVMTSPVVWGGAGTVGQHAFHQLLYQGTRAVPLDFIVIADGNDPRRQALADNALAQAAALTHGRSLDEAEAALRARGASEEDVRRLAPHLAIPGNQASTTLLLPMLEPFALGALMALYEHKVFVQGWIWGIDSFDQYGVELGKEMARRLAGAAPAGSDASTLGLQQAIAALRGPAQP
ncbi:glucose-6-phosphate isomerase [Pseudothauera rhizosphaerae]|uniref:Glucose-6-phosphate isomerase n=1 Tax=Pseudothauera rhizosphaerae TaxID=2565932 RepID=A0A4V6RX40_9RHOO|nr:glucose-6-phosphate isomerase [Pseudothauera rhizosphaerae]THF60997.1 glucose-6-phosphate isomerase [Pseudothauera rhizosphaerae]